MIPNMASGATNSPTGPRPSARSTNSIPAGRHDADPAAERRGGVGDHGTERRKTVGRHTHRRTGDRDAADRLGEFVEDRGGDATHAGIALLVVDRPAAGADLRKVGGEVGSTGQG